MSAPRVPVHLSTQPIRWGDMDALGHVNNTVYFRYMEQARIEWLEAQRRRGAVPEGTGIVVVNASCTFLVPLAYPGEVEVRMYLGGAGRTSIESRYELDCAGERAANGAAKIVWVDYANGRPVPLPAAVAGEFRAS
ncbi:MAG: acyl-CoA thioesterase [Burkholderiales bacterium]|nr:acyl-CoA thioesterase [Burkholderiales bacterium]